jgi:hypothetical protein
MKAEIVARVGWARWILIRAVCVCLGHEWLPISDVHRWCFRCDKVEEY